MEFAKRLLMVAGALMLAGIVATVIAPKTAHGMVAALVQVVTTPATPVLTEQVNDGIRVPFQTMLCATNPGGSACVFSNTLVVPASVTTPGGVTFSNPQLVIEFVSGSCENSNGSNQPPFFTLKSDVFDSFATQGVPFLASAPVRIYVSTSAFLEANDTGGVPICSVSIHGYLTPRS
jgi:hypothetical protein